MMVVECDCAPLVPVTVMAKLCCGDAMNPPLQPEIPAITTLRTTSATTVAKRRVAAPLPFVRLAINNPIAATNDAIGKGPSGNRGVDIGGISDDFAFIAGICTVMIEVALLSPGVTEVGVNVAVAPAGSPDTDSATG